MKYEINEYDNETNGEKLIACFSDQNDAILFAQSKEFLKREKTKAGKYRFVYGLKVNRD